MSCENANGLGKLKIIETPAMGNIAKALCKAGAKLGVSSRGSGNVNESGLVSDFDIVTVDIVAQPNDAENHLKNYIMKVYLICEVVSQIFDTLFH